jgi:tetratricopeptide (TPR) repeat protein
LTIEAKLPSLKSFHNEIKVIKNVMTINVKKFLAQADKAIKSGNIKLAKNLYQTILNEFPKNAKAKKGILNIESSSNLSNNQINLPKEQINKVVSLYNNGQFQEAINLIKILNNDYPNVPLLFNILGACHKSLDQIDTALKMFETASSIKPDYAEAYFNQGVIFKGLGRPLEAIERYKKAIFHLPNYPDAYNNLGNAYKDLELTNEAIESYEWAIAYNSNNSVTHLNLGIIYSSFNQKLALKQYQKAIEINPNYSEVYFNMGSVLRHLGKKSESIASYEKAISIMPDYIEAHKNLSAMKLYKNNDPHIKQMESLLSNNDLCQKDQISMNFALAKVYEDLKDPKVFFKYLNQGNKLRKIELNYSIESDQKLFTKIREVFKDFNPSTKKLKLKRNNVRPIFILGMPRSGTSLVEQIISSHQKVYGAGELEFISRYSVNEMKKHYSLENQTFSHSSFYSIREGYLESLKKLNLTENIVTDKMPLNFRFIGFILSAFPEAKIVHLKRDARATCWSIYKYYFKSDGNGYAHNLEDLASYFSLYTDLMKYWHKLFPNQIYDISYEQLTTNQESETQKLLEYCDLDWDENCLNFHDNRRAVKTTSALQVRQKMYQGSSEAWKKYEFFIQPLVNNLKKF